MSATDSDSKTNSPAHVVDNVTAYGKVTQL